jgi:hypothetical protein
MKPFKHTGVRAVLGEEGQYYGAQTIRGAEGGWPRREPLPYIPRQPPPSAGKRSTQTLPRDPIRPLTRDVNASDVKKLPPNHLSSFPPLAHTTTHPTPHP